MAASRSSCPPHARVEIRTASARLEPTPDHVAAGELFVGGDGTVGVKMSQGNVRVEELAGARRTMTASLEPVFLPKRPATSGPLFAVDAPAESPAAGAKAVFSPKGESLGFLQPDKQLVVRPGYTADLTQPFPPKTVQLAMAKIPAADSADRHAGLRRERRVRGLPRRPDLPRPGNRHAAAAGRPGPDGAGRRRRAALRPVESTRGTSREACSSSRALVIGGLCLADEWPCEDDDGGGGAAGAGGGVATALRPRR